MADGKPSANVEARDARPRVGVRIAGAVVILALAALAAWALVQRPQSPDRVASRGAGSPLTVTTQRMMRLLGALHLHAAFHDGALPAADEAPPPHLAEALTDAWGSRIRWTTTEAGLTLTSLGPDREPGTADDVRHVERAVR